MSESELTPKFAPFIGMVRRHLSLPTSHYHGISIFNLGVISVPLANYSSPGWHRRSYDLWKYVSSRDLSALARTGYPSLPRKQALLSLPLPACLFSTELASIQLPFTDDIM